VHRRSRFNIVLLKIPSELFEVIQIPFLENIYYYAYNGNVIINIKYVYNNVTRLYVTAELRLRKKVSRNIIKNYNVFSLLYV